MAITLESAVSRILSPVVDMATEERVSQVPLISIYGHHWISTALRVPQAPAPTLEEYTH